ncbi:efflux RND transporter periplasmic adaptor subunit [Neoroseomonas soli]|uniref:Efflux RND transporter periplasmic adaptor subunit n=1 Tax=Neoroseomonas soli TaxID=1081025 RepID=A0A9X9WVF0_9PROT|nr:efflux RND transporter periplasmic adaptor subunit [Neoroseomonas soli]MBR0671129.1 efflux RND transporter periplasmic adaptor subunit [Neoroseomonas soli]
MRTITQVAVLALIGGAGAAWHFYGDKVGLPPPLELLGMQVGSQQGGGRGGGAGGPVGVIVQPVRVAPVVERVESVGTVRAREAVTITSKVAGIVEQIRFTEGERVEMGTTLVQLDAAALRAELDQARAMLDDARNQLVRARQLQAGQTIAAQRLETLEALSRQSEGRVRQAEARLEELRVTAPFSGRVGLRQVSPGALIQPGTTITTLDDTARVRVEFSIPEVYLARIRVGSGVTARSSAYGTRRFQGTVAVIDTRIDPATRSIRVISEFDNSDEALRPGLFLTVELVLEERERALLVAEEAIDPVGDRAFVFVVRDGRARRQEVKLGLRLPGEVEVREGLNAGEPVVVRGVQRLRNDLPVRVVETLARPTS